MNNESSLNFYGGYKHYFPKIRKETEEVYFLTEEHGTEQLSKYNTHLDEVDYVFTFSHRIMNYWLSPFDKTIVFSYDIGGNEMEQLACWNPETKQVRPLANDLSIFHFFGCFSPNETSFAFSRIHQAGMIWELCIQDLYSNEETVIFESERKMIPISWHQKENPFLLVQIQESNLDYSLHTFDLASRKLKPLKNVPSCQIGKVEQVKNMSRLAILMNADKEYNGIWEIDLNDHKLKNIVSKDVEIDDMKYSFDGETIAYVENDNGFSSLFLYDEENDGSKALPIPGAGVIESLSWLNDNVLLYTFKSFEQIGTIWRLDVNRENLEPLLPLTETKVMHPKKDNLKFFNSFDGKTISYYHFESTTNERGPVIIYLHGGPESQSRPEVNNLFDELTQVSAKM